MKTLVSGYDPAMPPPLKLEEPRIAYPSGPAIGRYVDILYDQWFKRILGAEGNEGLILDILRELIPERTIDSVSYTKKKRRKVNPFIDGHDAYFDIECTEKDGTRFVVEMQKTEQVNFPERALFYATFPIQEQVEALSKNRGQRKSHDRQFDYAPVYIVSFLNFSQHKGTDQVLFRYGLREDTLGDCMTDRINFIFLEMTNLAKDPILPEDSFAEKLSYAFTHIGSLKERPAALMEQVFQKLFAACELKSLTQEKQTQYKTDMTTKRDWENILYTAELLGTERGLAKGIAKGIVEGIEKGMAEGMEKGMAEGMEKGMAEGARNALIATARRMVLELGYAAAQAAEVTGLKPEEFLS